MKTTAKAAEARDTGEEEEEEEAKKKEEIPVTNEGCSQSNESLRWSSAGNKKRERGGRGEEGGMEGGKERKRKNEKEEEKRQEKMCER